MISWNKDLFCGGMVNEEQQARVNYRMAGTFHGSNFRGKSEKALKINFRGFIIVTESSLGA